MRQIVNCPSSCLSRAAKGDNVLDICCGSGDVAFLLAETVGPEGQVGFHLFNRSFGAQHSSMENLFH